MMHISARFHSDAVWNDRVLSIFDDWWSPKQEHEEEEQQQQQQDVVIWNQFLFKNGKEII